VNTVKSDFTGLKTLMRQVEELPTVKTQVGLFADTAGRVADHGRITHNPTLGYIHENGWPEKNIPQRSFLLMPLMTRLGPAMQAMGASWLYIMRTRGVKRMMGVLGALAEDTIQEAFATGGFGLWPALHADTIRRKKSSAILIESAQMRKAVGSRVV
jgi:hypothetical protein